jgi:hypothetical protein
MATFPEHPANGPGRVPERRVERAGEPKLSAMSGSSAALAIGGAAAIILTIIGLSGGWPIWMATLTTLIVGVAFVIDGLGIMARNMQMVSRTGGTLEHVEASFGVSPEFLAGCAGVVLGILGLVGIYPILLSGVALIAFGGALFFGATPRAHLVAVTMETTKGWEVERSLLSRSTAAHVMVGLGAMTLGILAVYGIRPLVLTLAGLLSVGCAVLLTGSAVAYRMASRLVQVYERARI